jgi:hypothetical protein
VQLPGLKQFTVWAIELTQNKAMFNRSRRNLARWFTLSMGGILVVFSGILYYQKAVEQLEVTDRLLYKKTRVMAASVQCEFIQGQARVDLSNVPFLGNSPPPLDSEIVYARWYDEKGKLRQFFGAPSKEQLSENVEFKTIKTTNNLTQATPRVLWLRQVTLPVQYKGQDSRISASGNADDCCSRYLKGIFTVIGDRCSRHFGSDQFGRLVPVGTCNAANSL